MTGTGRQTNPTLHSALADSQANPGRIQLNHAEAATDFSDPSPELKSSSLEEHTMKRVQIEFPTRTTRVGRRTETAASWNEWIDDETDIRKLRIGRKLDKVRRAVANQSNESPR
jgi:hypothetical protein